MDPGPAFQAGGITVTWPQVAVIIATAVLLAVVYVVCNRTRLAPGKTPLEVEKKLLQRVPAAYRVDAHHWLILLGRYVCQARKPRCWECNVVTYCKYTPKTPAP